jgi:hypothetical protein
MSDKLGVVIALTVLALVVGVVGAGVFIGVGESLNSGIAAFAAVSLPFALLAGFFSWLSPRAAWPVVIAMDAPVILLCLAGVGMGAMYLLGAMWTIVCTAGGAALGAYLRRPRSEGPPVPPS